MRTICSSLFMLAAAAIIISCGRSSQKLDILTQSDFPAPPVALVKPDTFHEFGNTRIDNYYWMLDKTNPQLIEYLNAENAYSEQIMAHTSDLQEILFIEMKGRIKEDDQTVPNLDNGYYYFTRTFAARQYPVHLRKKDAPEAAEEILLDVNQLAEGYDSYILPGFLVSPDNSKVALMYNNTGSYADFNIKVKDLVTGEFLSDTIRGVSSFEWANDSKTIIYSAINKELLSDRVYIHILGDKKPDRLIFQEVDNRFNITITKSLTKELVFINLFSFNAAEVWLIPADSPQTKPVVFVPRKSDVLYEVHHHKTCFYVLYKDTENKNFKIWRAPLAGYGDMKKWTTIIEHDPKVKIQSISVFDKFMSLYIRADGLDGIRILKLPSGEISQIDFPETVYTVSPDLNSEYSTTKFRYNYSSMNRPQTWYDYDTEEGISTKLKEQEIPGGFNPDDYIVERLWAAAPDSEVVPMAIVYRKGLLKNGKNPAMLQAYGSYGTNTDASFRSTVFSLVDRGFIFGIAQVRGGSELGEEWYEDGRLMNKKNTFSDFISCAEKLVKDRYSSPSLLGIAGGSAGGLLMGAVVNMRPELFNVVLAAVPFVDIINTMLDENLPWTTLEYEQWGNPHEETVYKYIMSYSPYDNIKKVSYPNMLITAGLNDSQVWVHEPAKYTAKLRAMKTDDNILLLKTNMESGHGGATGRYDYLKELAFQYAYILDRMGKAEIR